jgi:GxxExxY protein
MNKMPEMQDRELTERIIGCAMKVHSTLGPGFLESVYQKALAHELRKAGLIVEWENPITVTYDGVPVGDFSADLLVENRVMLELKANNTLAPVHEVQLVNYLTATGIEIGLLLNFGAERLEFKRKTRTYRPTKTGSDEQEMKDLKL